MNQSYSNASWDGFGDSINLAPRSWRDEQDYKIKISGENDTLKRNNQSIENIRKIGKMFLDRMSNVDVEKTPKSSHPVEKNPDPRSDLDETEIKTLSQESRRLSISIEDLNKARAMFNQLTRADSNKNLSLKQPVNKNRNPRDLFTLRRNNTIGNNICRGSATHTGQKCSTMKKSVSGSILRAGKFSSSNLDKCALESHFDVGMRRNSQSQVAFSLSPCVYHYEEPYNIEEIRN